MSSYRRTKITRLRVAGLRSLRDVELVDLPDLVVLHGPNGSGKSTLGRAVGLALKWLAAVGDGAPLRQPYARARERFDLEPDDFTRGGPGRIEIAVTLSVGESAAELLRIPGLRGARVTLGATAVDLGSDHGIEIELAHGTLDRLDLTAEIEAAQQAVERAKAAQQVESKPSASADQAEVLVKLREVALEKLQADATRDLRSSPTGLHLTELFESVDAFRRVLREVILGRGAAVEPEMLQTLLRRAALSSNPREFAFFESLRACSRMRASSRAKPRESDPASTSSSARRVSSSARRTTRTSRSRSSAPASSRSSRSSPGCACGAHPS
ncbi:MAG: AAA family ATPase [Deltaproteobacteria bacterium]|nr:AAA family ATPase [Deltaproteobacteria bacterium]